MRDLRYLQLLAREYPTTKAASSEIINLSAIMGLPKGTEYYFSDLHGEYEAFLHLLKSASGIIRTKITDIFGNIMTTEEQDNLANLIYYPESMVTGKGAAGMDYKDWERITIYRLVQICKEVSSKYTRSKVRKKMPKEFAYVIDELLHVDYVDENKKLYYSEIVHSIIEIGIGDKFITALCQLIQNLTIDRLHIIGDIFDRGPRADIIMNELMQFHDVDIQWGNHDISWMGAATGNRACIANVVRIGISYNNFDLLEDGYGFNLRALSMFAAKTYGKDDCKRFTPHIWDENLYDAVDPGLAAKMHKAIAVIQFKLEGQILKRHPEYEMNHRRVFEMADFEKGTVSIEGSEYTLLDQSFPTVDPKNPLKLTAEEEDLIHAIEMSFHHSRLLHKHIRFLYSNGSMYKCVNSNLLYHGCIPMTADGSFDMVAVDGEQYSGKSWLDYIDKQVQNAYFLPEGSKEKEYARDFMWYLWCGPKSPLFGKNRMTTFERYFIQDKEAHREKSNPYYQLSIKEEACDRILEEFGLPRRGSHIINGHIPVKIKDGESPVKANGKLFIIDGGLSKAYQSTTGIGGYTLIYNSRHLALAEHKPFVRGKGTSPAVHIVEQVKKRILVADTDTGRELAERIDDLKLLLVAYRDGIIKEKVE